MELKIFLLDTCAEVKLLNRFTKLYPTHNTILFRIYSTIIYDEMIEIIKRLFHRMNLYPEKKKEKKITKHLISFYTCMKNLTSLLVSIEKFFHESERYDKNKSYILPKN